MDLARRMRFHRLQEIPDHTGHHCRVGKKRRMTGAADDLHPHPA
jgi:hypothetical protein